MRWNHRPGRVANATESMRTRVVRQNNLSEDDAIGYERVPMRWAVRADSHAVVHIASLARDETGLKCGCICPECDATLQAVNAGRPPAAFRKPGSLGQFFRHDSGQQRDDCLFGVARLAALKLVVESGEIDLPPATATQTHCAPSGDLYEATATGTAVRASVLNYHWIDRRSAVLTLGNGRTVLVHLKASNRDSSGGPWDAELTITVNDPEVASWSAEKILEQIRLNPDFTCWERHWQHPELAHDALAQAKRMAAAEGDAFPAGLAFDGPLPQGSESPLHWLVKTHLVNVGRIRVPEASEEVSMTMPDRTVLRRIAKVPATVLELLNVRLEHRLAGIVPDVLCTARDPKTGTTMELLIEVAVTHRVDDAKLKKITTLGLACLELDATNFSVQGRVRFAQVTAAIITDVHNKRWLHHPHLGAAVAGVTQKLREHAAAAQLAIDRARERTAWLESRSDKQAKELFLTALARPRKATSIQAGDFAWKLSDLAGPLAARGWESAADHALAGENSILHTIHWIRLASHTDWIKKEAHALERLASFLESPSHRKLASLVSMAFKVYAPALSDRGRAGLDAANSRIKESLARLETDFARPTDHDAFVAYLFPEMRKALDKPFGTRKAIDEANRAERARKREEDAQRRQREHAHQRQQELRREQEQLHAHINSVCRFGWMRSSVLSRDVAQILSRPDVRRVVRQFELYGFDASGTVASAWQAREEGTSINDWFMAQRPADSGAVGMIQKLLQVGWLLQ